MISAHQMSSAPNAAQRGAIKRAPLPEHQIVWPEEDYSAFYKQHLYLAVMDDFAAFSGGIHKYADHVIRKLLIAIKRGQIQDFQMSWIESPDASSHPFHGRNLRNFIAGKDSAYAIWAVLDLYMKVEEPLIARGFQLEGYLERLGLCVSEYIQPSKTTDPLPLKAEGLYSARLENGAKIFLDIEALKGRRFALAHAVTNSELKDTTETVIINGLRDNRTRIDKGICVPQAHNDIVVIRDIESADASFGFVKVDGDDICFHRILLDGSTETHTLKPDDNPKIRQWIKAASINDGGPQKE